MKLGKDLMATLSKDQSLDSLLIHPYKHFTMD